MFIYGRLPIRKKMGYDIRSETYCPNCQQISKWEIFRVMSIFTFFFIPLFPYRVQYFLICPHCETAAKLKKAEAKGLLADYKEIEGGMGVPTPTGAYPDKFSEVHAIPIDSSESFIVPAQQIVQTEKRPIRKVNSIFAGVGALLLILWLWDSMQYIITLIFAVIFLLPLAVFMPIQYHKFNRNKERLPEKILVGTDGIWIDSQCIKFYSIREVEMTSMKLRASGFHPLQRFLSVETDTERIQYWLGSPLSLPDSEYAKLCNMLESACQNKGIPFSYSMKKSYMR